MKILIVDDDQLTATTWSMGLKSAGMEVITAASGQEGLNQVKTQKPDIVLLDQIMPDMLGNAVLTTLKQDPETANIPVMLISNYNESQMMKEAIEMGAIDYILKYQIETRDLVDKVKGILSELHTAPMQTPTSVINPVTPPPPTTPPSSDIPQTAESNSVAEEKTGL